ncbi:MAG: TerB family tellurite resistance protein [Helicobacteraceae bacterium]|jgi:DnaJ like chaperone protein|nr:TerB family tellurite resistance protein [Helicobacteraceae bacterium]
MSTIITIIFLFLIFRWIFNSYKRFQRHYYTQGQFQNTSLTYEAVANSELGVFVALVAKVAKADGRVHELEAELVSNMFGDISKAFGESHKEKVREILKEVFNREKEIVRNVDMLASKLQALTRGDKQKRLMMITFLINLAYIDGELSHAEENLIIKIAAFIEISGAEVEGIMQRFASMFNGNASQSSVSDAYAVLGASRDDDLGTIKKKYRALVKKYHPDIMKAKGASEEYIKDATQKVQKINTAYEMVKKEKA